jgi:hypothetical protein
MEEEKVQGVSETESRKQYVAPVLVEYGSISKLTLNNGGSFADGSGLRNGGA